MTDRRHHRARSRLKTGLPTGQNEAATMPMRSATRPDRGCGRANADIGVVDDLPDVAPVSASVLPVIETFLGSLFGHLFADAKVSESTAKIIGSSTGGMALKAPALGRD